MGSLGGLWGPMIIGTGGNQDKMEGTDYSKEGCHSLILVNVASQKCRFSFITALDFSRSPVKM